MRTSTCSKAASSTASGCSRSSRGSSPSTTSRSTTPSSGPTASGRRRRSPSTSTWRAARRLMPVDPNEEVLADLVAHKYPVSEELWGNFWDRLRAKELRDGEALAFCTTLSVHLPDGESVANLLASLRERNPQPDPPTKPTVNIVGTGGGPSTF